MIITQLEKSFIYESSDNDVCFSHLSDLSQADFNDFKYKDSKV